MSYSRKSFRFLTLPLETLDKAKETPHNCATLFRNFKGEKQDSGNSTYYFFDHSQEIPHCFKLTPWKSACGLFNTPENSFSLTPHPCLFFFLYSACALLSTASVLLIQALLPAVWQVYIYCNSKMHIWIEFVWNQKFLFVHKRSFKPKWNYKLFLIKLSADIS